MSINFNPYVRFFLCVAPILVSAGGFMVPGAAYAVLELVDDDVVWPASAPVRTQSIPATFNAASRGVRGDRYQYQTFEVTEAISLDSVLIGYGWVGGTAGGPTNTNFTDVTIYEITRTYNPPELEDAFTLGDIVVPQTSFIIDGTGKSTTQFYAMQLKWDAETSGELILPPRTGLEGYAIEINGTHTGAMSSAINLIERNGFPINVYTGGRAYEFQNARPGQGGTPGGPYGNGLYEFPIVLTAVASDGDFNDDGFVDAADYVEWRKTNSGDPLAYDDWVRTFGMPSPGAGGGNGAVPEPTGALLLGGSAWSVFLTFRQRRRMGAVEV
jgi:hypothetical protein